MSSKIIEKFMLFRLFHVSDYVHHSPWGNIGSDYVDHTPYACLFVCLAGFLTSSSTTTVLLLDYIADGPQDRASDNLTCCHTWDRAGGPWLLSQQVTLYWLLTPTQPVGSGRPQRESNPAPPYQSYRASIGSDYVDHTQCASIGSEYVNPNPLANIGLKIRL